MSLFGFNLRRMREERRAAEHESKGHEKEEAVEQQEEAKATPEAPEPERSRVRGGARNTRKSPKKE